MPNLEPVVLAGDYYSLRLIGPQDAVWPTTPNAPVTVLANDSMVARPLPMSNLTSSPDFVSGNWIGRLGDAGEGSLTFPNKDASDGVPWRQRFDPTGHLQFMEIYRNGELDFCGVIDAITTLDRQQVQIHCYDGMWLLKKAYERDWTVTQAPRDVIERGAKMWVPTVADNFAAGTYVSGSHLITPAMGSAYPWAISTTLSGSVTVNPSGGANLNVGGTNNATAAISNGAGGSTFASEATIWSAQADVGLSNSAVGLRLFVTDTSLLTYAIYLGATTGSTLFYSGSTLMSQSVVPGSTSYSLLIESDGEWVTAYVNGTIIGQIRRMAAPQLGNNVEMQVQVAGTLVNTTATVQSALVRVQSPFLLGDSGDYVLPGTADTYPTGGLHARYFNDLDLQSNSSALSMILSPTRQQSYGTSSPAEYANQQDAQIDGQNPPGYSQTTPGPGAAALQNWSCRWFGAIYLKLSDGSYGFQWNNPGESTSNYAVRIWIGKTQLGAQLVDEWSFSSGTGSIGFSVTAADLEGTLPYDGGTVARDGWYPIKIEFACGGATGEAGALILTSSPAAYTDPGGTAIAAGVQSTVVPATSLSPLGCVDQRYQGISHFDLAQQTAQAYGYQISCEPKQLESGLFPGVLAPRVREGHDTDIVLSPDLGPRQDGEGILNYSSGLDASDFACSLTGNGAGFQNGNTGQLQATVFDPGTMLSSLFDAQQWQDFSDASFASLLQALLNSQLGLQLEPWQLLSADPHGRPRQSYTWPLPGELAAMRWRPGDGLRINAPDINVFDTSPRQMLTITRNILPNGTPSTQASFALRPRTPAHALKQQLYKASRLQRNYQRQRTTITGGYVTSAVPAVSGGVVSYTSYAIMPLNGVQVIGASLRIPYNSGGVSMSVEINGTDQTSNLGGPWVRVPLDIDITAYAVPSTDNRLYVRVGNNSTVNASAIELQVFVDVLR